MSGREALAAAVRAGLGCHRQDDITEPADGAGEEYSVCDEHDEDWPCAVAERVVDALLAGPLAPLAAAPGPEGEAVERVRAFADNFAECGAVRALNGVALQMSDLRALLAIIDRLTAERTGGLGPALDETSAVLATIAADGPDLRAPAHIKCAAEAEEFAENPTLEEAADVLITVRAAADHRGWSEAELAAAVRAKNAVNAARTWALQGDGTWQHVPEGVAGA